MVQCVHHGDEHQAHMGSVLGPAGVELPRLDPWVFLARDAQIDVVPGAWADALLARFTAFSGWATGELLRHCLGLGEGALAATAQGTYGSIQATLAHLIGRRWLPELGDRRVKLDATASPTCCGAELRTLAGRAGWALLQTGVDRQANVDLLLAARRLGAAEVGWTIVERLGAGQPDAQLETFFGQDWDVLEETAMSLGFGQTVSALDLCADAALLASGEPMRAGGKFYDLGDLRWHRRRFLAAAGLRAWVDQLLAHPDLALRKECRDHLTHRTPRRQTTLLPDQRGRTDFRQVAELTTLHGQAGVHNLGSIADLVPRLVGFGEEQLELLCLAILTPGSGR